MICDKVSPIIPDVGSIDAEGSKTFIGKVLGGLEVRKWSYDFFCVFLDRFWGSLGFWDFKFDFD